jgi:hypothetical protein
VLGAGDLDTDLPIVVDRQFSLFLPIEAKPSVDHQIAVVLRLAHQWAVELQIQGKLIRLHVSPAMWT